LLKSFETAKANSPHFKCGTKLLLSCTDTNCVTAKELNHGFQQYHDNGVDRMFENEALWRIFGSKKGRENNKVVEKNLHGHLHTL
jgi:hypothetical protein